jgi:hypothetical protein
MNTNNYSTPYVIVTQLLQFFINLAREFSNRGKERGPGPKGMNLLHGAWIVCAASVQKKPFTHSHGTLQHCYKVVPPPSDIRDAAAAAAVGTTPVETPGFDKCRSLQNKHQKFQKN